MELVHCQIAKQPISPERVLEKNDSELLPAVVSSIIMKLMAKTAEERYQSAWGIQADLEVCLRQWETTGRIEDFPLGCQDISDKFYIPQKLYGREKEIENLLNSFERVATPKISKNQRIAIAGQAQPEKPKIEITLVSGCSGVGKSVLVKEIYRPVTEKRCYFISGKFDQFQQNIPYSAVVDAFQELVRQLLTESSRSLSQWRAKLLAALGRNGQVIVDVIPDVELIIGKQPPTPTLGPTESQNRFKYCIQKFYPGLLPARASISYVLRRSAVGRFCHPKVDRAHAGG